MNTGLKLPFLAFSREYYWLMLWIIMGVIGGFFAFPLSFVNHMNVIIGSCLIPFAFITNGIKRFNYIFLILFIFFGLIAFIFRVRMFYFYSLAFYIFFLLEFTIGKTNSLLIFLIIFISPVFQQMSLILGFPIRLKLSFLAGKILLLSGYNIVIEGNLILLKGEVFAVDEACMGLNMLAVSMLMGVFLIAWQYRESKKVISFFKLSLFFIFTFSLNIFSNLLRIILLVILKIQPDNPLHEIIGVLSLCTYVITPLYFLSKYLIKKYGISLDYNSKSQSSINYSGKIIITTIASLMIFNGFYIYQKRELMSNVPYAKIYLKGFQNNKMGDGITIISNEDMLVYIKPIPEFYTGEHSPLLCWKGSGYNFKSIKEIIIDGNKIYSGQLIKPGSQLFTAWWYYNGKVQTIDQFDWRMRMIKGEEKFCLINVTAKDEFSLNKNLNLIFKKKLLSIDNNAN